MLAAAACFGAPRGNPFPRIGEIRLNDLLVAKGQAPIRNMSVFAIGFSPGVDRLAIQFGDDIDRDVVRVGYTKREYLFVVSTGEGNPVIDWIDLPQRTSGGPLRSEIAWSPDGALVLVNYRVLTRLPGGDTCTFPGEFRGFLSAGRALLSVNERGSGGVTVFAVADSHCAIQERWRTDRRLIAPGVTTNGNQLAILALVSDHPGSIESSRSDLLVLPVPVQTAAEIDLSRALRIRSGRPAMSGFISTGGAIFTGGAICAPFQVNVPTPALDGGTLKASKTKVQCWDAQSGKPMHATQPLWSRGDVVVSAGAGRIAVSDSGAGHDPAKPASGGVKPVPQLRGVWDVHTGKMLAAWSPDPEMHASVVIQPIARRGIAISADGKMLAESGNDSVLVYRLP
jgi:hypothetical protein